MHGKIQARHLERKAYVYVRQSTAKQVFENTESTARQYGLAERAFALGWTRESIEVIDADLGHSAKSTQDRRGFAHLTEAVARGEAGAILALEVSRWARSSQDWQRLLALCAVAEVLVIDEQAIYDPKSSDDRLLLDFKGTMSEAELHWLTLRLRGAQNSLAKRGELGFAAPTGYTWGGHGFEKDPDRAVQSAIGLLFERFQVEPTVGSLVRWARKTGFQIPTRRWFRDGTSDLTWRPLYRSRVNAILTSPIYAGAYVYGRRSETKVIVEGEIVTTRRTQAPEQWTAFIQDAHEGYIRWETYLSNRKRLRENAARRPNQGAPREGRALLTGVLLCGRCGQRMKVAYVGVAGKYWTYVCSGETDHGGKACWTVSGAAIDAAVEDLLLSQIIPSELELSLALEQEVVSQASALSEQWKLRLEKVEYEARRAERRYKAVDPDNRVVARTLEADWESCLREREVVRGQYESAKQQRRVHLTPDDRARVRELARDLPAVWHAPTTQSADRKAMLRLAIDVITIAPIEVPERRTRIQVQWKSGAVDELTALRNRSSRTSREAIGRIEELAASGMLDAAVAKQLNEEKFVTGALRSWTAYRVKKVRLGYTSVRRGPNREVRKPLPDRHPDGRYSVTGAMKRFDVTDDKVRRWIKRGLVEAVREDFDWCYGAWWLTIDDETAKQLEEDAKKRRRTKSTTEQSTTPG